MPDVVATPTLPFGLPTVLPVSFSTFTPVAATPTPIGYVAPTSTVTPTPTSGPTVTPTLSPSQYVDTGNFGAYTTRSGGTLTQGPGNPTPGYTANGTGGGVNSTHRIHILFPHDVKISGVEFQGQTLAVNATFYIDFKNNGVRQFLYTYMGQGNSASWAQITQGLTGPEQATWVDEVDFIIEIFNSTAAMNMDNFAINFVAGSVPTQTPTPTLTPTAGPTSTPAATATPNRNAIGYVLGGMADCSVPVYVQQGQAVAFDIGYGERRCYTIIPAVTEIIAWQQVDICFDFYTPTLSVVGINIDLQFFISAAMVLFLLHWILFN
jgi:hypothetical protein